MIISSILRKLFKDLTLTYNEYSSNLKSYKEVTKSVQYHDGDSKELAKWIRGRKGKEKYPLIWHLIEKTSNGSIIENTKGNVCLILFTGTKADYYNDTRAEINYINILRPLTISIYNLISSNPYIQLIYKDYEEIYTAWDIPNYGVDLDNFDYTSNLEKGTKAISLDIVDARRIEFQARFNTNCLI
jgi:hypothetical protein